MIFMKFQYIYEFFFALILGYYIVLTCIFVTYTFHVLKIDLLYLLPGKILFTA